MAYKLRFSYLLFLTLLIAFLVTTLSSLTLLTAWLYTFSVLIPSYYIIYESWVYPFYICPLRFVPTVPGNPLWGQLFVLMKEEFGVPQRRWHKQHGPIIRYFFVFGVTRISITDDEALKQVTVRNSYVWRKPARYRTIAFPILGEGLLLAEGDAHVQQRKALAPAFSTSSIKALSPIFWRKALLLSILWEAELRNENLQTKSIEVLDWLGRATLDIIGEAGFGAKFDTLNHPKAPLRDAYNRFFTYDKWGRLFHGLQYVSLAQYVPMQMQRNRDISAARNTFLSTATEIILDKQAKKLSQTLAREKDVIAMIVRDNSAANGKFDVTMTFETMRDQVTTFLAAGHDTTASAVGWTLHLLSKHPSTQEKLRGEIKEYMPFLFSPDREHGEDESLLAKIDEDRLPYLNNVCRESLRYIPPAPFTIRENTAEDQLCGYRIPVGTTLFINANTIHRVPEYWGDRADEFDPDRWDHLPAAMPKNAYLAFLHGPRGCIGQKFAETEMKTLLCCLLSKYRFEIDESVPDPEESKQWRIVLRPRDGITLKVTPLV